MNYFRCSCLAVLAADEASAGLPAMCPACHQLVPIPYVSLKDCEHSDVSLEGFRIVTALVEQDGVPFARLPRPDGSIQIAFEYANAYKYRREDPSDYEWVVKDGKRIRRWTREKEESWVIGNFRAGRITYDEFHEDMARIDQEYRGLLYPWRKGMVSKVAEPEAARANWLLGAMIGIPAGYWIGGKIIEWLTPAKPKQR